MNKYIFLASLLTLFGFKDSENVVFKSNDGKTKITATDQWTAAGNMKGVEIYISRKNTKNKTLETIVVSKDENIPETMDLSTYSAGKLFLQTSVLNTSPSFSGTKTIKGNSFKYYEYEYDNKDLVKMKTLVYHTLLGTTGYQMVITGPVNDFNQYKPMYNTIGNSLSITP
ncbi:MAG: hypothetical protein CMP63_06500 [Flavobacteriales bacterium]|nr:hypothetical protein [Flavobacteriales bacterium]|tara:strand:- start:3468 stop:3977 length:510 start_codon:yes stop_codon:yes gene_type:complete